ncbi:MAG TPA: hypothetical protein VK770_04005 [Candidatus Acidoferrum sp.]|nr:hypothetical protein [Candidatus Acidoferrum sp.]
MLYDRALDGDGAPFDSTGSNGDNYQEQDNAKRRDSANKYRDFPPSLQRGFLIGLTDREKVGLGGSFSGPVTTGTQYLIKKIF